MTPSPLSERQRDACLDMLENARAARRFTQGMTFEAFVADQRTNDAVVRCLEIISEASRRLGADVRSRHPQIPWRDVADAGNVYRHGYHGIGLDIVWRTVQDGLSDIIDVCRGELDLPSAS